MTRSSPRKSRQSDKGKGKAKKSKGSKYTPPDVFFELEKDYKKQSRKNKSSKKSKKKKDESDEEIDELASDSDHEDSGHLSTRGVHKDKKQKKAVGGNKQATKKKKNGSKVKGPSPFDKLPIETLKEICSFVDHRSLFYLSNISKRFHELLKSGQREIKRYWKQAREAVEPELPSLTNIRERELAKLLYGKTCFFCQNEDGEGDPFMRIIICKACRKEELCAVAKISSEFPEVMHQAADCCIGTFISPSGKHTKTRWVFQSCLEDENEEVVSREQRDLESSEADKWEIIQGDGKKKRSSLFLPDYDEKGPKAGTGKRVTKYVNERKEFLKVFETEGQTLWDWMEAKKKEAIREKEEAGDERRKAIEARLLQLEGYDDDDFDETWKKTALIMTGPSEIDDDAWKKLKPKIIKVVEHCRKVRQKAEQDARVKARLGDLRTVYEGTRGSTTYLLFADFCTLPSVIELFDPDDTTSEKLDKTRLSDLLDDIVDEADDGVHHLRLEMIKLVLDRTVELEDDEEHDDEEAEEFVEDQEWFNSVESFVCCDIPNCQSLSKNHQVFFGSFDNLLAHQLEVHSDLAPKFFVGGKSNKKEWTPKLRFSLPDPVVSAVSDIIKLGDLKKMVVKETKEIRGKKEELSEVNVTEEIVDKLFSNGTTLQWENAPKVGLGKSKKEEDWKKVVSKIKLESDKADKNGETLEPSLAIYDLVKGKPVKRTPSKPVKKVKKDSDKTAGLVSRKNQQQKQTKKNVVEETNPDSEDEDGGSSSD